MADALKFDLMDMAGGQNDGMKPTQIGEAEFVRYRNFYPYAKRAVRRNGITRLTDTPHAEKLTSIFALKEDTGVWTLILGRETGLSKLSGRGLVDLPISDGISYTSDTSPWWMRQYQSVGYAVRKNAGAMKRFTSDFVQEAGIIPPIDIPLIAQGGTGVLPAGDYQVVVTFYNRNTGVESNPSAPSAVLTLVANRKILWSNIPTSTTGQVTSRRLYRTLENQTGEYYFVAQIDDNITTTYNDNVIKDNLGRQASFDNGLPPANTSLLEIHKERCFVSDRNSVFFGELGLMECFAGDSIIQVYPDDGHEIRVLLSWGDRLVIGKTNGVHFLVGTDRSNFAVQTLSNRHGMFAQGSAKVVEGILLWYGGDDFYRSDGGPPQPIGTHRIKVELDAIPDSQKENVVAAVFPELGWYVVTIPQGLTTNSKVLVYNYQDDKWCVFTHANDVAPAFVGDFFDSSYGQILYATLYDGHLYQYHRGDTDDGTNIAAELLGKERGYEQNGLLKAMQRLHILVTTVGESVTVKVYRDGNAVTPISNRTVSLDQPRPWKRMSASTLGGPLGATLQIGFEYSGRRPIEISGIAEEIVAFRRASQPI